MSEGLDVKNLRAGVSSQNLLRLTRIRIPFGVDDEDLGKSGEAERFRKQRVGGLIVGELMKCSRLVLFEDYLVEVGSH